MIVPMTASACMDAPDTNVFNEIERFIEEEDKAAPNLRASSAVLTPPSPVPVFTEVLEKFVHPVVSRLLESCLLDE